MAATKYTYSLSVNFPNGIYVPNLELEIQASSIVIAYDYTNVAVTGDDNVDIWFKDALSAGDQATLDTVVANHNPVAPEEVPREPIHGSAYVVNRLAPGSGIRLITHNYCDPTTWWQGSTHHPDQATSTSDQLTYATGLTNLIDVRHNKLVFEDEVDDTTVSPLNGNVMTDVIPVVSVDGTPLANSLEDDPGANGYTIDYAAGTVTFNSSQGASVITVSCRQASSSMYAFAPSASNLRLVFAGAEIDLSENVDMDGTFQTVAYGSNTTITGGNVVPVATKSYNTVHDFQASANEFFGPLPAGFGGSGGAPSPKWTFKWDFVLADEFYATPNYFDTVRSMPSKITVNWLGLHIVGDQPFGGSQLTITYYAFEKGEGDP